jgi:hypothetical protein
MTKRPLKWRITFIVNGVRFVDHVDADLFNKKSAEGWIKYQYPGCTIISCLKELV